MKRFSLFIFLLLIPVVNAAVEKEFKVIPGVGIGLQKNYDIADFVSSDKEDCVLYHVGNPSSTDVVAWLSIEGDLSNYFTRNEPKEVFVPSGTFRYNATCCLIPIYACFKFPYVLEKTSFEGIVHGVYRGNVTTSGGASSITGSSVAYGLTINILPPDFIELKAGESKCIEFYKVGRKCFSAPWFVFSDYEEIKSIDGYSLKFKYKNNLIFIICVLVGFIVLLLVSYWLLKWHKHKSAKPIQYPQTSQ
jgi:hypothetical protein